MTCLMTGWLQLIRSDNKVDVRLVSTDVERGYIDIEVERLR